MKSSDLTSLQKKYKGLWVALTTDLSTVITANKDASTTYKEAVERGYKRPTLFKVPQKIIPYIGVHHVAKNI